MGRFIGFALVLAACGGGDGGSKVACLRDAAAAKGEKPQAIGRVDHCSLIPASYRFAYNFAAYGRSDGRQGAALDALIARELLAQAAQEAGIAVPTKDEVDRHIGDGELYVFGTKVPTEGIYAEGVFDYKAFKGLAGRAGLSVDALVAEQGRELLANAMRARVGEAALGPWLAERCARLKAAGRITIEPAVLERTDDNGHPLPATYEPCAAWSATP